jgi:hypothetical protein
LAALGQRGASLGEALSTEAGRPQASIERLEAIARQIEQLDEEITRIGHVEEAVGAIARTFAFGKENLSETPALEVLGRETVALYRALGRWAGLTLRLIDEVGCGGRPAAAERPRARGARADTVSDAV